MKKINWLCFYSGAAGVLVITVVYLVFLTTYGMGASDARFKCVVAAATAKVSNAICYGSKP